MSTSRYGRILAGLPTCREEVLLVDSRELRDERGVARMAIVLLKTLRDECGEERPEADARDLLVALRA